VAVMMEAILSSETSDLTKGTRRHIPEDDILHRYRREIFKSYTTVLFIVEKCAFTGHGNITHINEWYILNSDITFCSR
jgi:hypothetical protein